MTKDLWSSYRRLFSADVFRSVAARDLAAARTTTKRLLVVEDDPDSRVALQIGLADSYEVTVVPDGAAALSMLDTRQFDLMLVDVDLPGVILQELRTGRLSIPTVFACQTGAFFRVAKASGASCVMKPMRLATLEAELSFAIADGFGRESPTEPSISR